MSVRKSLPVFFLILVALFLAACRRGETALPTPAGTAVTVASPVATLPVAVTSTATMAVPATPTNTSTPLVITAPATTPAATTPAATTPATVAPPTAVPPTSVPPTATPVTGPPPGGSARINFAPGATSAIVSSTLAAGGDGDTWLLRVAAGQVITARVIANPPGHINITLLDSAGGVLQSSPDTLGVSSAVPVAGDYQINLATASGAPSVPYTMQVLIPPASGPVSPTRIQFQPGQASAQLVDALAAGGDLNTYVLSVGAGQNIQVGVFASPPAATNITIRDTAGRFITSGTDMSGASATTTAAGDYFIDVSNFNAAPAINYTLTVTVPPLNPPPPVQPVRIEFGPGQISAGLNGRVAVGLPPVEYVIRLAAGQTLIADLNDNPQGNADVTVRDAAGTVLNFGRAPTSLGTQVAAAGDYVIAISTMSTAAVDYSLTVTAPPLPGGTATRIEFAPGATSATVSQDLPFGGDTDQWIVRGGPGQTMNVSLGVVEATGWVKVFVYNNAGQLIGLGTDITGVAAPLAAAEDYRIVVISDAAAGPLSYSMTVEIQ